MKWNVYILIIFMILNLNIIFGMYDICDQRKLNNQLIDAVEDIKIDKVEEFLDNGAYINSRDSDQTPVLIRALGIYAVCNMNNEIEDAANIKQIVRLLIKKGAMINLNNNYGHTVFSFLKDTEIAQLLLNKCNKTNIDFLSTCYFNEENNKIIAPLIFEKIQELNEK